MTATASRSEPSITTLPERKLREAARRRRAAASVIDALRSYARETGGRFWVFGSFTKQSMGWSSDLDILVDFSLESTADAWRYAEDLGREFDLPVDLHDARTAKPNFLDRVLDDALILS